MSIGNAALYKAIATAWAAYELDAPFRAYWTSSLVSQFPVLNDKQAEGDHPHPYCVLEIDKPRINSRSSASSGTGTRHIRDVPIEFVVYAKQVSSTSAKAIAAAMAEEIIKVFGGHPTTEARIDDYALDHGHVLIFQFDSEFDARIDIENHEWRVSYNARLDLPIA